MTHAAIAAFIKRIFADQCFRIGFSRVVLDAPSPTQLRFRWSSVIFQYRNRSYSEAFYGTDAVRPVFRGSLDVAIPARKSGFFASHGNCHPIKRTYKHYRKQTRRIKSVDQPLRNEFQCATPSSWCSASSQLSQPSHLYAVQS